MLYFTNEQKNLFFFLISRPFSLLRFLLRTLWLLVVHIIRKKLICFKTRRTRKIDFCSALGTTQALSFKLFPAMKKGLRSADVNEYKEIKLATTTIPAVQELAWTCIFEDIEDTFSLNRFGWLFTAIHAHPNVTLAHRALKWITNWIDVMGENYCHPAWESYSVSERLSNWPFILIAVKNISNIDQYSEKIIARSIGIHLQYLKNNLEIRGTLANNHILNNARGLYIGGLIIGDDAAVKKAKEIFYEWTPRLFFHDGVLMENSSHYQFLLSQRFEQIYLLSLSAENIAFTTFIRNWSELIRGARDFFHVWNDRNQWTMPIIGDISPDFNPDWLSPISTVGWEAVKSNYEWKSWLQVCNKAKSYSGVSEINGHFLRYDHEDITVFWHIGDNPMRVNHGHFDTGSFVLFLRGREVFSDPGRRSYTKSRSIGKFSASHSCLMVDGLGPFCEDSRLNLLCAYPCQTVDFDVYKTADFDFNLSMTVHGFKRLFRPVTWIRTFSMCKGKMIIRDEIDSKGVHELETKFIIAKGLFLENMGDRVRVKVDANHSVVLEELSVDNSKSQSFLLDRIEISREYGKSELAAAVILKDLIYGKLKKIYEIRWAE